jgi:acyl-CoA synthetase (NDP forming)/GNAT superfamily N-acetyltransferase
VRRLHERLSSRTLYLRYFSAGLPPERYLTRLLRPADRDHLTLVSVDQGEVVAVAGYERLADPGVAEVAFLVDDAHQGRGIGTLLVEHLAASAEASGVERFVAETLADNAAMLGVFRDAGFSVRTSFESGEVRVEFPVRPDEQALAAADLREAFAEFQSVHRLLVPRSVTVVGAGHDPTGLGHLVFANILQGGFAGPVFPVNRDGAPVLGVPAYRTVRDVPGPVDLVVVVVPAPGVLAVARDSAAMGAQSLVVITAGFAEAGQLGASAQQELLRVCRAAGMRLVGPNCMGLVSNVEGVTLHATFSPTHPSPGSVGFMSQSGAVGIAAMEHAARSRVGVGSFVSAGNKADISGNDLLCFWERDPDTEVCALYLESFGNPRKFARIARRVGRTKPIVAVKSGRSVAGTRGVRSHTAAAATPEVAVDALFGQAGVIRADSLSELFDIVTLLDRAPLPAGNRVAIVGNSGGPGVLAADACEAEGLRVPEFDQETRARLAELLPPGAGLSNPVDLLAGADPARMESVMSAVLASPDVDSVIAVYTPVLPGGENDMAACMASAAAGCGKPVVAVILGVPEPPASLTAPDGRLRLPFHPFPEPAARALAAVTRYAAWRRQPQGTAVRFGDVDESTARELVRTFLAGSPEGGWLPLDRAAALVRSYGVVTVPTVYVADADSAVEAAAAFAGPVAVKAAAGALVHKTDLGGIRLGLSTPREVKDAFADLTSRLGDATAGAVVQPMVRGGVETAIGVVSDPAFGPLVMFGLGGVASDLLADRSFRIIPLSRDQAAAQVRALRSSALLFGYRGSEPVDVSSLEEMLLRVAQLAAEVPEIAELDLNPVVARADGALALDVKVRLARAAHSYPLLRRL